MIELRWLRMRVPGIQVGIATSQLVTKSVLQIRHKPDNRSGYPESDWSEWSDVPVIEPDSDAS